jgi:hypothetical protein
MVYSFVSMLAGLNFCLPYRRKHFYYYCFRRFFIAGLYRSVWSPHCNRLSAFSDFRKYFAPENTAENEDYPQDFAAGNIGIRSILYYLPFPFFAQNSAHVGAVHTELTGNRTLSVSVLLNGLNYIPVPLTFIKSIPSVNILSS